MSPNRETNSLEARSAEEPRKGTPEQTFRDGTFSRAKAANTSAGRALRFQKERAGSHRVINCRGRSDWLTSAGWSAAFTAGCSAAAALPTDKMQQPRFCGEETHQHQRWKCFPPAPPNLLEWKNTSAELVWVSTCGTWPLRSAPWSSRWSTWRCSPSAPCCCPRSGCGPGSPRSARGNSATR